MAKKTTAKTKPAASAAAAVAAPPIAAAAPAARPPAGRKNKAAPTPPDATAAPAPLAMTNPSPAAVTAPPKKSAAKSLKASARPKVEALASAPAPKPTLAPNNLSAEAGTKAKRKTKPTDAAPSTPEPVPAPQRTASTLLGLAAKAVKLVGKKAAKLKKEVAQSADLHYAERREVAPQKEITQDEIAVRAYLISERRQQQGIHAEPHEDWAEAERQLRAEAADQV